MSEINDNVSKKRRARGTESVKNERKRLKTSGLKHTNYRNKEQPEKAPPTQTLVCKCKYSFTQLTHEKRLELFNKFYKCDKKTQGSYIMGLIQIGPVIRRRHGQYVDPAESRRQVTIYYTIPNDGEHIRVCRQTFSQVFALNHKQIQVLVEKKKAGEQIYEDKRGKNSKERKYNEDIRNQIRAHIRSFPIEENHYSRKKSNKKFLSPDLNINRMFKAFKEKHKTTKVTYRYYSDIFHKEFSHLRFGKPRSDTCSFCDLHTNILKTKTNDKETKQKLELHQRKAQAASDELKKDTLLSQEIGSKECVVSLDLQQVLFVPTLTHSQMFYSRQLSVYNLGIHIANTNEAFMCIWDESVSSRGGNEIASCLLRLVLENHLSQYGRKLIVWTDNCIGQNKNKMMLLSFIFLVMNNMFDEIEQKFLVSGHSYMPCDRDFALIEKRKRVEKCFTPDCIEEMIKNTRHLKPFHTVRMQPEHFKNLHAAADSCLNTTKLNISKASILKITKNNPSIVKIKKTFSEAEEWKEVKVLKKGVSEENLKQLRIQTLTSRPQMNKDKLQNLKDMIAYLPTEHQDFYKSLLKDQYQHPQACISQSSGR